MVGVGHQEPRVEADARGGGCWEGRWRGGNRQKGSWSRPAVAEWGVGERGGAQRTSVRTGEPSQGSALLSPWPRLRLGLGI